MRNFIPVLFFFIVISVIGCNQNTADNESGNMDSITIENKQTDKTLNEIIEEESTEANYEKPDAKGNKKITSDRYGFTLEIPSNWTATDKSNNGDGYFLSTGDKAVDIRVYGENLQGNEIMAEMELATCETSEKYIFGNGYPGIKCYQSGDYYYYYDTPKTRVIFYVHATKNWVEKNKILIESVVKSLEVNGSNFQ